MRRIQNDFNIKRFFAILIPFSLVAVLMVLTKPKPQSPANKNPYPLYFLHIESDAAAGSIILNDISIGHHKTRADKRPSKIALTPWLMNGKNKLYVSTQQVKSDKQPSLIAKLEMIYPGGQPETKPLFELTKPSAKLAIINAENLPQWSWQKGEATFHDSTEIKAAVRRLHQAFKEKNTKTVREVESPMFADMVRITEREGLERRHHRDEIIQKGKLDPLKKLIIVPFANGKVMRVTQPDGEAPIRIYFRYGNGGKVIVTGKFWSKIEGEWRVVR